MGDSRVRTSGGPVGSNHHVDSSSDRSVGFELLSRQVEVEVVNAPNHPTCLDSRRPLSPGPGAYMRVRPFANSRRPLSPGPGAYMRVRPFANSRGSAEGRPALELTREFDPSPTAVAHCRPALELTRKFDPSPTAVAHCRPGFDDYLVPTLTNLRATMGDARVRHLSGPVAA